MNWFQRYGIPGAYFFGLTFAWVYAFYGCTMRETDITVVIGAVAIVFLPIGYIISALQQWLYLKIKCLGVHKKAFKRAGVSFSTCRDDEPTLEAYSLLLITQKRIPVDLHSHEFMQDWNRRRMDVIAINSSLIVATVLAVITALIPRFCFGWNFQAGIFTKVALLIVVSLLILVVMCLSVKVLRDQIIEVIAGLYEGYKRFLY